MFQNTLVVTKKGALDPSFIINLRISSLRRGYAYNFPRYDMRVQKISPINVILPIFQNSNTYYYW